MKNKGAIFRTVTQLIFILAAFIMSIIIANGFSLNFDNIWSFEFLVSVLTKLAVTMITYNMVFSIDNGNRRRADNTKYYNTLMTNRLKIEHIYKEKRIDDLDKALKDYNHETYIKECNRLIHKCTSRLNFNDIDFDTIVTVDEIMEKYKISKKIAKKLLKRIRTIQNGKVNYDIVEVDDILIDKDERKDRSPSMVFNSGIYILKQNLIKAVLFLVSTVLLTIVSPSNGDINIWAELVKNATLLLGGTVSAMTLSLNYIKIRTDIFEQRNRFLLSRMDINISYTYAKERV